MNTHEVRVGDRIKNVDGYPSVYFKNEDGFEVYEEDRVLKFDDNDGDSWIVEGFEGDERWEIISKKADFERFEVREVKSQGFDIFDVLVRTNGEGLSKLRSFENHSELAEIDAEIAALQEKRKQLTEGRD